MPCFRPWSRQSTKDSGESYPWHCISYFSVRVAKNGHSMRKSVPVHLSFDRQRAHLSISHVRSSSSVLSPADDSQAISPGKYRQGTRENRFTGKDMCVVDGPGAVFSEFKCLGILKESIKLKSLALTKRTYSYVVLLTTEPSILLHEHLVLAFAKLGGLDDAVFVFDNLQRRTAFPWTAMIDGFADHNQPYEAINMYQCMLVEGVEPDRFTFISLFKACGSIGDLKQSKELHFDAQQADHSSNIFVSNTLISMYGKCGGVAEAQDVFYEATLRSVVSWTAMIAVYVENNLAEKGLLLFRQMQEEGLRPNDQTFVGAIQACSVLAELEHACDADSELTKSLSLELGRAFHVEALRAGFLSDVYVVTTLVSMYGKCEAIVEAEAVFGSLLRRNVASWTAMISAYVENGCKDKALLFYRKMQEEGVSPNEHTFVCALQASDALTCNGDLSWEVKHSGSLEIGQALHADARTSSFVSGDFLGNALISMYGRHGILKEAENVFVSLNQRSVVSWTAMLSAYVEQGKPERALQLYQQMHEEGAYPNQQTLVMVLQACGTLAESNAAAMANSHPGIRLQISQSLHKDAERTGLSSDVFVGSALLSMYAKFGAFSQAKEVFSTLPWYDTGCWNAMLASCLEQDQEGMTFDLYKCMLDEHVTLDSITLMNVLQASAKACILYMCQEAHFTVVSCGQDSNMLLGSALIHTYGCCLDVPDAETALMGMLQPDMVSWNACIGSHAAAGNGEASAHILEGMMLACILPDRITFGSILSACNHSGLLEEGLQYFHGMCEDHCLSPDSKHFASVIDLLGRAGAIKRVENVLCGLHLKPDMAIWLSVLGSCYNHNNMELGRLALLHALRLQLDEILGYDSLPSVSIGDRTNNMLQAPFGILF